MTLFTSSLCFGPSVVGASSDEDPQRGQTEQAAGFQIYELQCSHVETQCLTSRDL